MLFGKYKPLIFPLKATLNYIVELSSREVRWRPVDGFRNERSLENFLYF